MHIAGLEARLRTGPVWTGEGCVPGWAERVKARKTEVDGGEGKGAGHAVSASRRVLGGAIC